MGVDFRGTPEEDDEEEEDEELEEGPGEAGLRAPAADGLAGLRAA